MTLIVTFVLLFGLVASIRGAFARRSLRRSASTPTLLQTTEDARATYDDNGYSAFVAEMWSKPGVDLRPIVLERAQGKLPPIESQLQSVVLGNNGQLYVNTTEGGRRLTLAADDRHKWFRGGEQIDVSGFVGVSRGIAPNSALRAEVRPKSFAEAILPEFDRSPGKGKHFVIAYRNQQGATSYRVISHVVRMQDSFSARCHFRFGERRTFLYSGLTEVTDRITGKVIEIKEFVSRSSR